MSCGRLFSIRPKHIQIFVSDLRVDTRRKLNVHKTFRRRPGRLLDVLCTFSLLPVSTGQSLFTFGTVSLLIFTGWSFSFSLDENMLRERMIKII